MSEVTWSKKYDLKVDSRHFKVFVSEHKGNGFHASCLWYERGRMMKAPGEFGSVSFLLEQRHASSEEEALKQIKDWATAKFGSEHTFEDSKD